MATRNHRSKETPNQKGKAQELDNTEINSGIWSSNPSKRRGEKFFLGWAVFWVSFMAWIVISRAFEKFDEWTYLWVGIVIGVPPFILPLLFPGSDAAISWRHRYTTKANIWIWILSFIGNYFWTHYFYTVLNTSYTFPSFRLNNVPIPLFLITHAYFHLYHVLSNIVLRYLYRKFAWPSLGTFFVVSFAVFVMSYTTAFMEAYTIENFPYYVIPDRYAMYLFGSVVYGIYFIVSFPMFFRLDETPGMCWSIPQTIWDSLAACMLVTVLLDFWRLFIGNIHNFGGRDQGVAFLKSEL